MSAPNHSNLPVNPTTPPRDQRDGTGRLRQTPRRDYVMMHHGQPMDGFEDQDPDLAEDLRQRDMRAIFADAAARRAAQNAELEEDADDIFQQIQEPEREDEGEEEMDISEDEGEEEGEVEFNEDQTTFLNHPLEPGFPSMGFTDSGENPDRIKNIGHKDLLKRFQRAKVLPTSPVCPGGCKFIRGRRAGQPRTLTMRFRGQRETSQYRCQAKDHPGGYDRTYDWKRGPTLLEKSWLTMFRRIPLVLYIWARMLHDTVYINKHLVDDQDMGADLVNGIGRVLREVCLLFFHLFPLYYDVMDDILEIDESVMISKRKKGNVHLIRTLIAETEAQFKNWIKHYWVFGIVSRLTGLCVLYMVKNRRKLTLLPLIRQHIAPGCTVHSDEFSSYKCLNDEGYDHRSVNHSESPVAEDGTHSNTIESLWKEVKILLKAKRGVRREELPGYLAVYSFKRYCKHLGIDPLNAFVRVLDFLWNHGVIDADWLRKVKGF